MTKQNKPTDNPTSKMMSKGIEKLRTSELSEIQELVYEILRDSGFAVYQLNGTLWVGFENQPIRTWQVEMIKGLEGAVLKSYNNGVLVYCG